jgi:peptide/nickel transport system permease protein
MWIHRIGIVGIAIMSVFVITAVFGDWLAPKDPVAIDLKNPLAKPVWADPENGVGLLGTDNLGRDVLSRMLVGSQLSLIVAFSAVTIGMISGVFLGLLTGYKGGRVDDVIMRIADTQTAIPFLVLLIAVIAFLGGGLLNMIVFIGLGGWVGFARLIRGEVLSIRERDYVHAARALGVGDLRIMLRHIMPNAIQPAIVGASLLFGGVILTEAALSFLGLGVNTLVPTWGKMIADSRDYITLAWHLNFPAVAIMLVVLGANLLGDWLRDILDPRLRGRRG